MSKFPARHHPLVIALHWISFFIIAGAIGAVLSRDLTDDSEWRKLLFGIHKSLGMLVFVAVVIRLAVRYRFYSAQVNADLPKRLSRLAQLTHIAIYSFLFILPVTGLLATNAAGKQVSFFGLINIPPLMDKNRELAENIGELHETLAWIFIMIIALHTCAALWHHYLRKDQVLLSMLPRFITKLSRSL